MKSETTTETKEIETKTTETENELIQEYKLPVIKLNKYFNISVNEYGQNHIRVIADSWFAYKPKAEEIASLLIPILDTDDDMYFCFYIDYKDENMKLEVVANLIRKNPRLHLLTKIKELEDAMFGHKIIIKEARGK